MPDELSSDQRYQIVMSLHKIEQLIEALPQVVADAIDKALSEIELEEEE